MFAVEGSLSQVRFNLWNSTGSSEGACRAGGVGHGGRDTLPCLWGELHPDPGRQQEGKEIPSYPCLPTSLKSHGERSLSSLFGVIALGKGRTGRQE